MWYFTVMVTVHLCDSRCQQQQHSDSNKTTQRSLLCCLPFKSFLLLWFFFLSTAASEVPIVLPILLSLTCILLLFSSFQPLLQRFPLCCPSFWVLLVFFFFFLPFSHCFKDSHCVAHPFESYLYSFCSSFQSLTQLKTTGSLHWGCHVLQVSQTVLRVHHLGGYSQCALEKATVIHSDPHATRVHQAVREQRLVLYKSNQQKQQPGYQQLPCQ